MLKLAILIPVLVAIALILKAVKKNISKQKSNISALSELQGIRSRPPLTPHEQKMYVELSTSLPSCTVLAQVAMSALITTNSKATRNRFDRKVIDFVICTKQLAVIAIVELDDATHKTKQTADTDRDAMLANAGYTTLRYPQIPSQEKIKADVTAAMVQKKRAELTKSP